MIHVVIGMHKSGTTLVAALLHESGIPMREGDGPSGSYDDGDRCEMAEAKDLNLALLGSRRGAWSLDHVRAIDAAAAVAPDTLARMRSFLDRSSGRWADWGFKDPRTALTYGAWRHVLPAHRVIVVFRHPWETWAHYAPRTGAGAWRAWPICWKALRSWHLHNAQMLRWLQREPGEVLVLEYGELMTGGHGLEALARFVGRPIVDVRRASLYRHRQTRADWRYRVVVTALRHLGGRDLPGTYDALRALAARAA